MKNNYNSKDILDAIEKIASIPLTSHYVYYFTDKFVKNNPEFFYCGNGKLYLKANNEEVITYSETYNTDGNHNTVYIIPIENAKPLKVAFENENIDIINMGTVCIN